MNTILSLLLLVAFVAAVYPSECNALAPQLPIKRALGPLDCDRNPNPRFEIPLASGTSRLCMCRREIVVMYVSGRTSTAEYMCMCKAQIVHTSTNSTHECTYRDDCKRSWECGHRPQTADGGSSQESNGTSVDAGGNSIPTYGAYNPGDLGPF